MNNLFKASYINGKEMLQLVGKYQRARKQENKDRYRDDIFLNNARMIRREVCRNPNIKKEDWDDAFNICVMNFLHGLDKFDLKKGCYLSTYMMHWIKKGISDFIYSNNIIHISQGAFGGDFKDKAMNASNIGLLYLDKKSYIDSSESIIERFYDTTLQENPENEIFNKFQNEQLFEMVNKNLTKREAIIIRFKYFEDIKWSSKDFESVLKISRTSVDNFERIALFKLRKLLQNKDITGLFPETGKEKTAYIPTEKELISKHKKVLRKTGLGYQS